MTEAVLFPGIEGRCRKEQVQLVAKKDVGQVWLLCPKSARLVRILQLDVSSARVLIRRLLYQSSLLKVLVSRKRRRAARSLA